MSPGGPVGLASTLLAGGRRAPEEDAIRIRARRRPADDAAFQVRRNVERVRLEMAVRALVGVLVLVFNGVHGLRTGLGADPVIRAVAALGVALNGPYYLLAARTGRWFAPQFYGRMLLDTGLMTAGLYAAGGAAAAPYLVIYTLIPLHAGLVLSSVACLVATAAATVGYVGVLAAAAWGWLPATASAAPGGWGAVVFNLLVLNLGGGLTAILADAYRQSQRRLGFLYQELERAHDEALALTTELQRASRLHAIGEVAAGVAHEVNNALQSVIMPIGLLRDRLGVVSPPVRRHLDQIEEGAQAAARILRSVLVSARASAAQRQPVRLPDVARRIVELKRYDLRRDRIAVSLEFPGSFPAVQGVPLQLQQVLLNLVTNAQQALADVAGPRTIAIVGWSEAGQAIVEVRDSGPGIPASALPRLFEGFYTTKATGTGLGLVICAGIVRDHSGDLLAANRSEGGAVLRLSLPALSPEPGAAGRRPAGQPLSAARTS
jgi:signal transduction histidine kinase